MNLISMVLFLSMLILYCEQVYLYSSFWAPLFNPRILNYKVDINFDPETVKRNREDYKTKYGYRGENLITDLGNGRPPPDYQAKSGDIKFYYTYK